MTHQAIAESKSEWHRKNNDYIFEALVHGSKLDANLQQRMQNLPFSLEAPFQILLLHIDEPFDAANSIALFLKIYFISSLYFQGIASYTNSTYY